MESARFEIDNIEFKKNILARLRAEQVVMLPTDTIYGLSARADSKSAIKRIYAIKKRDKSHPLLVLVSSLNMAKRYCEINSKQQEKLIELWSATRPTTVILKHRRLLPAALTADKEGLAVRLPKSEFLRKMIRSLGVPLISTSANFSGEPVLDGQSALKAFSKRPCPDFIVIGGKNRQAASRLVSLHSQGKVTILRK
ncbi:hypothetical protein CVU83_01005 [Candidatus Falkowbacteria bacterium HGW-Falkowbacteria-2]|uniref:L-threonylcarbamoyladenylate synthase n=1 Tax=Candidatus Falkowbacteria bacterium HGW-Falkowbacteria-2 TaxID=2013769 RepID=A0A2N2E2C6_9BACT|nr:MAG: hypothetical protein CVU83_01005 [Candidatus Falkowbacteria bacterium HGW-Falkowbacteria-2]